MVSNTAPAHSPILSKYDNTEDKETTLNFEISEPYISSDSLELTKDRGHLFFKEIRLIKLDLTHDHMYNQYNNIS